VVLECPASQYSGLEPPQALQALTNSAIFERSRASHSPWTLAYQTLVGTSFSFTERYPETHPPSPSTIHGPKSISPLMSNLHTHTLVLFSKAGSFAKTIHQKTRSLGFSHSWDLRVPPRPRLVHCDRRFRGPQRI
jgi:hypothetical protein